MVFVWVMSWPSEKTKQSFRNQIKKELSAIKENDTQPNKSMELKDGAWYLFCTALNNFIVRQRYIDSSVLNLSIRLWELYMFNFFLLAT